jgi:hypothetical protein
MTCRYSAEISRRPKFLAIGNSGSERRFEEPAFRFSAWTMLPCRSLPLRSTMLWSARTHWSRLSCGLREKLDWLRRHLRMAHGIPSHDTVGRMFGLIDPEQFEAAFWRWVKSICSLWARRFCRRRQNRPPLGRRGRDCAAGHRGEVQRNHGHFELLSTPALSVARSPSTVSAHTDGHSGGRSEPRSRLCAGGEGQLVQAGRVDPGFLRSFRAHPASSSYSSHSSAQCDGEESRAEWKHTAATRSVSSQCIDLPHREWGSRSFGVLESGRTIGVKTTR